MTQPFSILVVCTGNICRSPMGERILRHEIDTRLDPANAALFTVSSAGTYFGHAGEPMQSGAQQVLVERGVSADGFNATALDESIVAAADLILTAERQHRSAAVRLHPAATNRAFTLREFGRHVDAVDRSELPYADAPTRMRALLERVQTLRGTLAPVEPSGDDITDPYGMPVEDFRRCADAIAQALASPLDRITRI